MFWIHTSYLKQKNKNGGADLPEGVELPINSLAALQTLEDVLNDKGQIKQMVSCQLEHFKQMYLPCWYIMLKKKLLCWNSLEIDRSSSLYLSSGPQLSDKSMSYLYVFSWQNLDVAK